REFSRHWEPEEIGRASCREREKILVVEESVKKRTWPCSAASACPAVHSRTHELNAGSRSSHGKRVPTCAGSGHVMTIVATTKMARAVRLRTGAKITPRSREEHEAAGLDWDPERAKTRRSRRTFFFQAEDGIRYWSVTGVQTCALPIS